MIVFTKNLVLVSGVRVELGGNEIRTDRVYGTKNIFPIVGKASITMPLLDGEIVDFDIPIIDLDWGDT